MQLIKITGTKMEQENVSLFALYNEKVNKSRKLKELKEEIEYNKSMKKYKDVRQKLGQYNKFIYFKKIYKIDVIFSELLTSMVNVMTESQEKINSKRTATIVRLQQDLHSSSLTAEKENILLVPQKKQKYLKNIVKNKESIENLFCSVQNHDFNNSCLKATEDAVS